MSEISVFDHLKPFCVRAIENPSKEAFSDLENVFTKQLKSDNQASVLIPPFQEYLSFPMKMVLLQNDKFSEATSISALKTLNSLLRLSSSNTWESFSKTFTQLFTTLSNPTCQIQDSKLSTELKLELINCAQSLISKNTGEIQLKMMSAAFCPALGHSIFVLLWMSQNETQRELRITAMETIICLFTITDPDTTLLTMTGKRLASFLPGICIAMMTVATGDVKQGSKVTITSLKVWTYVVSFVMGDKNLAASKDEVTDVDKVEIKVPEVIRNKEWLEETSTKLQILMKKIATLVSHEKYKVRFALLEWAEEILTKCTSSLSKHIQIPLDVVITLNLDEYPEVSRKSQDILNVFDDLLREFKETDLITELEENIYAISTKLPRIFRVFDDSEKISALNLLAGYIKLIGPRKMRIILFSESFIDRLMLALLQLIQLDTTEILILENKTTPSQQEKLLESPNITWPRKYFKHFRDERVFTTFCNVCKQLGAPGDISHIVDYLLVKARQSSFYRKESILILNEIIMGQVDPNSDQEPFELVRRVIEEYVSDHFWNLEVTESESKKEFRDQFLLDEKDSKTPENIRSNIIQKCLLLEGISRFSKVLTRDFKLVLLTILCPFLEEVGSSSMQVSHTATLALRVIVNNGGTWYSCQDEAKEQFSIADLIFYNCDYLAHSLSIKLRHIDEFPNAPIVLDVICRFAKENVLTPLEDLIYEVLRLLDIYHNEKSMQLLKVLQSLLTAINRWFDHGHDPDKLPKPKGQIGGHHDDLELEGLSLKDFLVEYDRLHKISENLIEEEIETEVNDREEEMGEISPEMKDKKKERHIEIAISVLKRCVHMQSSPILPVRILTQDLIQLGVQILKEHEDDLLPLVHELWDPLVRRFIRDDNVVTLKAFETLLLLSEICGDFIRKRTLTDVWPKLISILEQQRLISLGKDDGSAYRFTIQYKLQLKILTHLGNLLKTLDVKENELESCCCLLISYLCEKHPQTLLQAAKEAMKIAETVDSDLVWFAVKNYSGSEQLYLPHKDLRAVNFTKKNPLIKL